MRQQFAQVANQAGEKRAVSGCFQGPPRAIQDYENEVRQLWAQGTANTLELARLMCGIRDRLARGQWTSLWKSGQMPFSERKGYMLLVIGDGFGWTNLQMFAGLPTGWSILYHLARLDRTTLERLIRQGVIRPGLRAWEARQLAAQVRGETPKARSVRAVLQERLRRFREFVDDHLADWRAQERELATEELTRLIEQIALGGGLATNGHSRICPTRCSSLTD